MNKDISIQEDSSLVLSKTKNLIDITNKILNTKNSLVDNTWIDRLWEWADENEISEYEWIENDDVSYWDGFPRDKKTLLQLVELDLFSLKTELSTDLCHLVKLKKLNIYDCNYKKLPKEIFNLTGLTHFSFSQLNQYEANIVRLIEIEPEIGNLTNIIELEISHTSIKRLPSSITNIINIKKLDISYNEIKKLPSEIGNMINLEFLILNDNELTELPSSICNLVNLEYLVLNDNPNLILSQEQIKWIDKLKENNCSVFDFLDFKINNGYLKYFNSPVSNDLLDREEKADDNSIECFTFDNGGENICAQKGTSRFINILNLIIDDWKDNKYSVEKIWLFPENIENDIWFSITGQTYISKKLLIEFKFNFYQYNIYLESKTIINDKKTIIIDKFIDTGLDGFLESCNRFYQDTFEIIEK